MHEVEALHYAGAKPRSIRHPSGTAGLLLGRSEAEGRKEGKAKRLVVFRGPYPTYICMYVHTYSMDSTRKKEAMPRIQAVGWYDYRYRKRRRGRDGGQRESGIGRRWVTKAVGTRSARSRQRTFAL